MKHTAYASRVIAAPIEKTWALFRNFNGLASFHPLIEASRIEDSLLPDQVGCIRYLSLQGGGHVREQLVALDDGAHWLTYSIVSGTMPVSGYLAGIRLSPVTSTQQTFVEWWADFVATEGETAALGAHIAENVFAAGLRAADEHLAR